MKCKNLCEMTKQFCCCKDCNVTDCKDRCGEDPTKCGQSVPEAEQAEKAEQETTSLELFNSKAMKVMRSIAEIDKAKKALDAEDAELRKNLEAAMQEYGIKKFDNEFLSVTFVEATTRTTVDSKKLEQELPDVYKKYSKTSEVKASVRIKVK